jgi:hypothetical protein
LLAKLVGVLRCKRASKWRLLVQSGGLRLLLESCLLRVESRLLSRKAAGLLELHALLLRLLLELSWLGRLNRVKEVYKV